jgi:hypothetical protein
MTSLMCHTCCSRLTLLLLLLLQCCDMIVALASLRQPPPVTLVDTLLLKLRSKGHKGMRHTSTRRLLALLHALRHLNYTPDFAFFHSFVQSTRYHFSAWRPKVGPTQACRGRVATSTAHNL